MSLHALSFSLIMFGLGAWQFRRAGRMARLDTEIETTSAELRQSYEAHGYPPTDAGRIRLTGAGLIMVGVLAIVLPMVTGKMG